MSLGAYFDMPKRLNTRQVLRHARSASGGGSGEHRVPVKISGGGRVRSPDPDGFSVCFFFVFTTSRKVTHMNVALVVKSLAWPCSRRFDRQGFKITSGRANRVETDYYY